MDVVKRILFLGGILLGNRPFVTMLDGMHGWWVVPVTPISDGACFSRVIPCVVSVKDNFRREI